jgi:hypothetical protein
MSTTEALPRTHPPFEARRRRVVIGVPDGLIAVALGAIAFVVRRHVPADGLFYDDAWQALGAWKGSPSELITVGQTQPGFTAGLMAWTRVFGMGTASLVAPALIAGTLGPPLLYLALRRFGFARSIALLAGAALTSAGVHIAYSYHVKTYTFDVLIVLGLALAVRHLAPHRWTTATVVAWSIGAIAVGSFSSIALIGTVVAGVVLVLHPSGDRKLRASALAAQLAALGALYLASSRTYSYRLIHAFFAQRDGYVDFDLNPVTFGRSIFDHLWNIVGVFPGRVPALSLALAGLGLLAAAWRGRLVVPARFLALMVVIAAAGGIVGLIPFGPPRAEGRVTLWMIPVIAVGLCTALELARRSVAGRAALRTGFDAILCVCAVLLAVSALRTDTSYPAGARAATRQVMANLRPNDAVVITRPTFYSFALYANMPVGLRATPERAIGFLPEFSDDRLHLFDFFTTTSEELEHFLDDADRLYVVHANISPQTQGKYLFDLAVGIRMMGFRHQSSTTVATGQVDVWLRERERIGGGDARGTRVLARTRH